MGRILDRLDRLQQRHSVLGFPYAVVCKYLDDGGGREAALITYYGFLSIFPTLLVGVTVVSRVLVQRPELRSELVAAFVPETLQPTVESAAAAMPTSSVGLAIGLIGLLLTGTGVVTSAYWTLNHLAAVPYRLRAGIVSRYLRVVAVLILILTGAVTVGGLTVVVTTLPGLPGLTRAAAALGSCAVAFVLLLLVARLLLDRPAPLRSLWRAAAPGAVAVTLVLNLGAAVLPGLRPAGRTGLRQLRHRGRHVHAAVPAQPDPGVRRRDRRGPPCPALAARASTGTGPPRPTPGRSRCSPGSRSALPSHRIQSRLLGEQPGGRAGSA